MMAVDDLKLEPLPGDIDVTKGTIESFRSALAPEYVAVMHLTPPRPVLTLNPCGIEINLETGEVAIPEGLDLTDAARAFWEAVQLVSGYRTPGFW